MGNPLTYKGYGAHVEFDAEDRIFVGSISGVRDIIGFHAATITDLEKAFREAVNDYVIACAALSQSPNAPLGK